MNQLHNHFEVLQGTVENPSEYAQQMTNETTLCSKTTKQYLS
jgi:hypothetical protein